jgi:hypothetical protein
MQIKENGRDKESIKNQNEMHTCKEEKEHTESNPIMGP